MNDLERSANAAGNTAEVIAKRDGSVRLRLFRVSDEVISFAEVRLWDNGPKRRPKSAQDGHLHRRRCNAFLITEACKACAYEMSAGTEPKLSDHFTSMHAHCPFPRCPRPAAGHYLDFN